MPLEATSAASADSATSASAIRRVRLPAIYGVHRPLATASDHPNGGSSAGPHGGLRAVASREDRSATLHTNHGAIAVELFDDDAPKTVDNFVKLARDAFYDGVVFHRIIPDFMIQGGDPTGTGSGGPGYSFEDEFNQHKVERGALAMANAGPNTNGSQFFIVIADACPWLDGKHTVFGRVSDGMDVVDAISDADRDARDRPREDVAIDSVEL